MKTVGQVYRQMRMVQKVVGYGLLLAVTAGLSFLMPFIAAGLLGVVVALATFAALEFLWIRPYTRRATEVIATLDANAEKVRLEREARLKRASEPDAS